MIPPQPNDIAKILVEHQIKIYH